MNVTSPHPPRLAVLTDYPDEGWPSMDLCGDMLLAHLPGEGPSAVRPTRLCPPFRRLATRVPILGRSRGAFNADRAVNRFLAFPRFARRIASEFDCFHIVDHSYSQLISSLPHGRVGVYCHDIDAFRCLVDPVQHPRPHWFRWLAGRILAGFRRAAVVFHSTLAVREDLLRFGLVDADRLVHAPYGVGAEFTPDPPTRGVVPQWLEKVNGRPWMLHVGSCVPRKRVDVLIDVLAEVRKQIPEIRLVKVGGEWSPAHRERIARLGLADAITHVQGVSRTELAEAYRRAAAVLLTSEAEGFGLPVIEALSCGTPVLASDIPALREAGGPAATYAMVGDIAAWTDAVTSLLHSGRDAAGRAERLAWAGRFTWSAHAEMIARAYRGLR